MRDRSDREDIVKVEEFLSGELPAFEFLFDKYREKVYRIAYRFTRNKDDALEIAQDVFLRVYTNLGKFKTDSKFFTWLYRITVNRSIDFTRSKKTKVLQQVCPSLLDAQHSTVSGRRGSKDPSEKAEAKELGEKLTDAVSTLSDKHRTVFLLHAVENLSYREIAGVMDSSIGTVMSRLFYARQKLQETLGNMGLAPASKRLKTKPGKKKKKGG